MANSLMGEAATTLNGVVYTLRFDFNAMCAFEQATAGNAVDMIEAVEKGGAVRFTDLRAMCWAMLQRHHSGVSMEQAGDILSADVAVIGRVIAAAAPDAAKAAPGNGRGRAKPRPA